MQFTIICSIKAILRIRAGLFNLTLNFILFIFIFLILVASVASIEIWFVLYI